MNEEIKVFETQTPGVWVGKEKIDIKVKKILVAEEPCDCGVKIRHNNGGNYHKEIYVIFVGNELVCWRFTNTRERNDNDRRKLVIGYINHPEVGIHNVLTWEVLDDIEKRNIDNIIDWIPIKNSDDIFDPVEGFKELPLPFEVKE